MSETTPVSVDRSRRVAFVAHCLVNQNAKVQEFARSPGVVPGVVERLRTHGYRIQQLPCPEMAFAGVNRWWQGRELYDLHRRLTDVQRDIARSKQALKEGIPDARSRAREVERLEDLTRESEQLQGRISQAEGR